MNGRYGFLYDEDGRQLQATQEFEASVELKKEEIQQAGKFLSSHKVTGGSGKGKVKLHKCDSRIQTKISVNPYAKYNYMAKLDDPAAKGAESVILIGVSFDAIPLQKWALGELTDIELDFTFDDYEYKDTVI
jgi:glutamate synthase domain-containing protein 3